MITFIETVFGLGLFINAMLYVAQIIALFRAKTSHGSSLITFSGFCLIQLFTILHAYIHKDYLLMFGNILSLVPCGFVTLLIIKYRIPARLSRPENCS